MKKEIYKIPNNEELSALIIEAPKQKGNSKITKEFTLFYFHGGGFIEGTTNAYSGCVESVVNELQNSLNHNSDIFYHFTVILPEYRLAPENILPAGIDDCVEVYQHFVQSRNLDSNSILFMGDSAGGNLVLSVTLRLLKLDTPMPFVLIPFSPWTDLTLSNPSIRSNEGKDPVLSAPLLQKMSDWCAPTTESKRKYSPLFESEGQ